MISSSSEFHERTVVVTGASRGIGRAISHALAKEGFNLVVIGRDKARLEAVAAECTSGTNVQVSVLPIDLSESKSLEQIKFAVPEAGLHGLIHNAGVCALGRIESISERQLDEHWQLNVKVPFLLTAQLLPFLRRACGSVVCINSGAGKVAKAGWGVYASSKHAFKAFADALRDEVSGDGVRVTSIFPGRTATDMQSDVHQAEGRTYVPDRFVQPEDVAAAVVTAVLMPFPALVEEVVVRPMP